MDEFIKNLKPFDCDNIPLSELRLKWEDYKRDFNYLAKTLSKSKRKKIKSIFLTMAGRPLQRIYENLAEVDSDSSDEEDVDETEAYHLMIGRLDNYFAPKQHDVMERFNFWKMKPNDDEPLNKFLVRAMVTANKCQFGESSKSSREIAVCDKMLLLAPPELRKKILETDHVDLDKMTKLVNAFLSVQSNTAKLNESDSTRSVNSSLVAALDQNRGHSQNRFCSRCGSSLNNANHICPARNAICRVCNKIGHFARKCFFAPKTTSIPNLPGSSKSSFEPRSEPRSHQQNRKRRFEQSNNYQMKKSKVNAIDDVKDEDPANDSGGFVHAISDNQDDLIWFKIGGVIIEMMVDSGSKYNIIDEQTWNYLTKNQATIRNIKQSFKQLKAYAQSSYLKILHSFEAELTLSVDVSGVPTINCEFYVVEHGSHNLLGKSTAKALGILHIGLPSTISNDVNRIEGNVEKFPFIKGVEVYIEVDEKVTPVVHRVRRVPLALRNQVEDELNKMLKTGIIEKVEDSSPWVSALVPVVKDAGREVRICVDMRAVNTAVKRNHHMIPTFDEILSELSGVQYFSILDVKRAYWQCKLNKECRYITTFITHIGMFRFTRLPFGISSAPEVFQSVMEQKLCGIQNARNFQDDILIWGRTETEHDSALSQVMKCMKDNNILLNLDKCKFKRPEIDFLGHHLSSEGVKPGNDKITAIKNLRAPKSIEELRSLLGLIGYVGKFISDLATKLDPLRALIKEKQFCWALKHEEILDDIKSIVTKAPVLGFFNIHRRTRVVVDASPVGLGAILLQFEDHTDEKPVVICYASKSLTETERRYCQTEKEALAVVWSMERFQFYLLGRDFEIETDHRPLEMIFKPSSRPPGRIERWILRMQVFQYHVVYRAGKNNIADPLSRLCEIIDSSTFDEVNEEAWINSLAESVAVDIHEIKSEILSDPEMQAVSKSVLSGEWKLDNIKHFTPFKDEITEADGYLIRNGRLIIPQKLRQRLLELAHEGHPGEMAMILRLRDRVWWPGIDKDARNTVKCCRPCLLVSQCVPPEPMKRRKLPTSPWIDIAIDFLGPLPCGETLLVVVDYYSRFKEVKPMKRVTAHDTITILELIFVNNGYPQTITLDNGRQLISKEFSDYCETRKITLNHTTPYWPQANGEVERQNRSLLKRLKISNLYNRDWRKDLSQYLMMYNTTPHSTTGKTPTELLRGQTIRSKIPSVQDIETSYPKMSEQYDKDIISKHKGKELEDRKRRAVESEVSVGDTVVIKNQMPNNKLAPTFIDEDFVVINKTGNQLTVQNTETNKTYDRNTSHVKKVPLQKNLTALSTSNTTQQETSFQPLLSSTPCMSQPSCSTSPAREAPRPPSPATTIGRPTRYVQRPIWAKDYVE